MNDMDYQDATIRRIEIIGEAAKNISEGLKEKYSKIEWRGIARSRDLIVHSYFKIDLDAIWVIIEEDLPILKDQISEILESFE